MGVLNTLGLSVVATSKNKAFHWSGKVINHIHRDTHSLTHSLTRSLIQSLTYAHSPSDGRYNLKIRSSLQNRKSKELS